MILCIQEDDRKIKSYYYDISFVDNAWMRSMCMNGFSY